MAITLTQLEQYLDRLELKYTTREDGTIVLLSGSDTQTQGTFLKLKEDGEMFSMETNLYDANNDMIKIPADSPHKLAIFEYILDKNFTLKFGCWEIDSNDGEIKFTVEFPIEDSNVTEKQFLRIMSIVMGTSANEMFSEVRRVIKTGSAQLSPEDEIAELRRKLAEAERRAQGGSDSSGI